MRGLIFDLDGTLVDTVYAHIFSWQTALREAGMPIDAWRVHRRIGMSGGLFARAIAREVGRQLEPSEARQLQDRHSELFDAMMPTPTPVRGAAELVAHLYRENIPFGIATSGRRPDIDPSLRVLAIRADTVVVERGDVSRAKPEPDLFLACQQRLGLRADECFVVGDAVWDLLAARRAGMMSVGVLTGGYGEEELIRAGAYRVYRDAGELDESLDELGLL